MKGTGTTRPPGAGTGRAPTDGALLHDVVVHRDPRTLPRGREVPEPPAPAATAAAPAAAARPVAPPDEGAPQDASSANDGARGYEAGFERGLEEGVREGSARGRDAAREEVRREAAAGRAEVADRIARLDRLLGALAPELTRRVEAAHEDMVALCHEVVCRILGEQLATRDGVAQAVRHAVRTAFAGAAPDGAAHAVTTIHVHPADLQSLQADEEVAAWLREGAASASGAIRWVADDRVQLGGCIVASAQGTLDARLETQLAALRAVLLRVRGPAARAAGTDAAGVAQTRSRGGPA